MPKVLLDTDILSKYFKGNDTTVARHAASYARQYGTFTFTSVTVHEIVFVLGFVNEDTENFEASQRTGVMLALENWRNG